MSRLGRPAGGKDCVLLIKHDLSAVDGLCAELSRALEESCEDAMAAGESIEVTFEEQGPFGIEWASRSTTTPLIVSGARRLRGVRQNLVLTDDILQHGPNHLGFWCNAAPTAPNGPNRLGFVCDRC